LPERRCQLDEVEQASVKLIRDRSHVVCSKAAPKHTFVGTVTRRRYGWPGDVSSWPWHLHRSVIRRRIRTTLDFSTARTIATSLNHSKLDYCNSLFLNFPQSQLRRLQLTLNFSAQAVSKSPKFAHITPVLNSLHWLKIEQCMQYKVASITCKELEQPSCRHSLFNVQSSRTTRSFDTITLHATSFSSFSTQRTAAAIYASITRHCYWF